MKDPKNILEAIDDHDVLDWFEHAELAQAITTHAIAQGILRQREKFEQQNGRKRRSDAGKARKLDDGQAKLLEEIKP
jgi:hypothetical protein